MPWESELAQRPIFGGSLRIVAKQRGMSMEFSSLVRENSRLPDEASCSLGRSQKTAQNNKNIRHSQG